MGMRHWLGLKDAADDLSDRITAGIYAGGAVDPSSLPFVTPWSTNDLNRIVFEDVWGDVAPENTRSAAIAIPALWRGLNLVKTTVAKVPLVALQGSRPTPGLSTPAVPVETQPGWLVATGDGTSPQHRMAWTVDDLVFYGWSCWQLQRNADGSIRTARRVNQGDWTIEVVKNPDTQQDETKVVVDLIPQDDRNVILIPGFHEGILSPGPAESIRDTRALYRNVRQRLDNPVPQINLEHQAGEPLGKTDRDNLIDGWAAARKGKNGGVAYTSPGIKAVEMGAQGEQLLIEGRNAAAVECARLIGVTASRVDATSPKASLNYETASGRNQEFVDFDVDLYMEPIVARLSMDDVTPHGTRVAFDMTDFTVPVPAPTGPGLED